MIKFNINFSRSLNSYLLAHLLIFEIKKELLEIKNYSKKSQSKVKCFLYTHMLYQELDTEIKYKAVLTNLKVKIM